MKSGGEYFKEISTETDCRQNMFILKVSSYNPLLQSPCVIGNTGGGGVIAEREGEGRVVCQSLVRFGHSSGLAK